jgi:hypothetical protein
MCSLSTEAFDAHGGGVRGGGGGGHMGGMGGAHFAGGMGGFAGGMGTAHFRGMANVGGVYGGHFAGNGYRGYGYRGYRCSRYGYYGGRGFGLGFGYQAYSSCYVWTPLGYINECGYDYNYEW